MTSELSIICSDKHLLNWLFLRSHEYKVNSKSMGTRDIIVVGASAGGVAALKDFVQNLPKDFKGSVFIVLHIPAYAQSRLPLILSKAGPLEAVHPQDEEEIVPGKIYVASNDYHLLIAPGKVMVK